MEPIRVGIIGCGQIARSHLTNYQKVKDMQVVAVCDVIEAAATSAAADFKIEKHYTDFREMLKREDISAVDVCLHNNFHAPVTIEALRAGKNVYCEKPMAGSYRDALSMLAARDATGKKLSIQLAMVFNNEARAAKELIEAGELGKIYHARSTGHRRRGRPFVDGYGSQTFVQKRNSAGGALYDMGVYHISQLLYLMDNPKVERVTGKTYQETELDKKRAESSGYDVEELGLGFVRFEKNMSMDIIEAWAMHLDKIEGSCLVGSKGGVRLEPFGFFKTVAEVPINATGDLGNTSFRWNTVRGDGEFYSSPQHHWIAALQGKVPLIPTAEIALNTMLISEGIYLSEKMGREVTADEVREMSVSTAVKV